MERGMEATHYGGEGLVVIADDPELEWPKRVLARVQGYAVERGFFVQRLMPQLHSYHLDDNPDLRSCNLILRALPGNERHVTSEPIDLTRLENFYGRSNAPRVRYVRERTRVDYGTAHESEYSFEMLESK